jgi:hypothetical protein
MVRLCVRTLTVPHAPQPGCGAVQNHDRLELCRVIAPHRRGKGWSGACLLQQHTLGRHPIDEVARQVVWLQLVSDGKLPSVVTTLSPAWLSIARIEKKQDSFTDSNKGYGSACRRFCTLWDNGCA